MVTDQLLEQWEQIYKRGLLSFWILLLLHKREMYAYEMSSQIAAISRGSIVADDNSVYRALRRFAENGLIRSEKRPSDLGPARRYFSLTPKGGELLARFIQRNVLLFQSAEITQTLQEIITTYLPNDPIGDS